MTNCIFSHLGLQGIGLLPAARQGLTESVGMILLP